MQFRRTVSADLKPGHLAPDFLFGRMSFEQLSNVLFPAPRQQRAGLRTGPNAVLVERTRRADVGRTEAWRLNESFTIVRNSHTCAGDGSMRAANLGGP